MSRLQRLPLLWSKCIVYFLGLLEERLLLLSQGINIGLDDGGFSISLGGKANDKKEANDGHKKDYEGQ
jgi:hypothetical protein